MSDSDDLPVGEEEPASEELVAALREYQSALESGHHPDRERFLAGHPAVADELADCLEGLDFLHATAPALRPDRDRPPGPPDAALGDFRIVRELGRGGMGVVYEAEQLSLGRRVALKVLPAAATLDGRQLVRFENEARAAAGLHHPNIVPVYAVGCDRGTHYYAMQLIDGRPLSAVVAQLRKAGRAAPPAAETDAGASALTEHSPDAPGFYRTVAGLGVQAAEALEYAHSVGVVHRDVKPANLLLDARGHLWVTDFGLARFQTSPGITAPGDLVGTLRYMSPEQAAGEPVTDPRGDVYALGATLYELVALRPAFPDEDRRACLRRILEEDPAPPRAARPAVPVELETVILKAMAKAPADRYPTARALADDLRRFLDDRPVLARRPSAFDRARRWARRHPTTLGTAVFALLLGVIGLAVSTALVAREQARTRDALDRERRHADEAEERFRLARRAADDMLQFGQDELAYAPSLRPVRQRLLEIALAYYQELIELRRNDPELRAELATARDRVERILADLAVLQGAGQIFLLHDPAVLAELKLTDDQKAAVPELLRRAAERGQSMFRASHRITSAEQRERFLALARANEADIAATLTPAQVRRLRQIALQCQGPAAFREPEVVAALKLTPDQRDRLRAIEFDPAFIPAEDRGGNGGTRPAPKQPPFKRAMDKAQAVLTPDQLARWKELTGEPFAGARPIFPAPFPRSR